MEIIKTDKAPKAIGPYSQGIIAGDFIYTSGQLGIDPKTGELANDIASQAHQAFKNIGEILKAAGSSYSKVVKTTVFVKNIGDFGLINEIYSQYFISNPARSLVEVSNLPKNALIEIEIVSTL